MPCKGNCAAYVKRNTPQDMPTQEPHVNNSAILSTRNSIVPLDMYSCCGIIVITIGMPILGDRGARESDSQHPKVRALLEEGTLNPVPEKVRDPKFQDSEFFDPRDIVQVKYEMLRRVSVENASVAHATEEYGVSRPTYYQTKASFDEAGIAGFVPKKRGPRGPHKLQGAVLEFIQRHLVAGKPIRARELAKLVRQEFGLNVHPRTIERAVAVKKTPR